MIASYAFLDSKWEDERSTVPWALPITSRTLLTCTIRLQGSDVDDENLADVYRLYAVLCILNVVKWLLIAAGVLLMCVSLYVCAFRRRNGNRITEVEDNNGAVVAYGNKAYLQQPEDVDDAISISAISDIIHNERSGVKNRRSTSNRFAGKSQSSLEQNKTIEDVAHGMCRGSSNAVTLSNVFM
jgi:hypothetical protein